MVPMYCISKLFSSIVLPVSGKETVKEIDDQSGKKADLHVISKSHFAFLFFETIHFILGPT